MVMFAVVIVNVKSSSINTGFYFSHNAAEKPFIVDQASGS